MRTLQQVAVVVAVALLTMPAPAQHESRGPLAGAAVAVLVDGGVVAGGDTQTRLHRNGFAAGATVAPPAGSRVPDLRAILQSFGVVGLDVDDISSGHDDLLVNAGGQFAVLPNSWSVLSFSLRQGATGALGSRIAAEAALGSVGAALFSWVVPGSILPPQLVGQTQRSHSRQDLGLAPLAEVDAIDLPLVLGLDQTSLNSLETGFLPLVGTAQRIYFTVSTATLNAIPVAWWGPGGLPSGATILCVTRAMPTAAWSVPTVYAHFFQLGLQQNEDIDALAIDAPTQKVLFSCVGNTRDQLLFVDLSAGLSVTPMPVRQANGSPVSTALGKGGNDDVDAVCVLDPTINTLGMLAAGGDEFGSSCGLPTPGLLGVPSVHASAFRRTSGGQTFFDTWMVGWPPITGVTPGLAALFVTIGNDPTLFPVGPIQLRNTALAATGDPLTYSLPMPLGYALSGQRITFRWVAIDAAFTEIAEAWPVQVFL